MKPATDLAQRLADRCTADGEFRLFARYWNGTLRFELGDDLVLLVLDDGVVSAGDSAGDPDEAGQGAITISGPTEVWDKVLAPVPPPFLNDIIPAQAFGLRQLGEPEIFWQYYPAVRRAMDLLRLDRNA
ncbi:MAG: hypothetical protein QOG64_2699 [Acidimicrobiaceae bacterium]|nr:hypothetical protein [Acidimicrobiaceae bacterium]